MSHRFAACDDGYMVYTVDPAVTAPNLAAVQELAVGFIRTAAAAAARRSILPSDTLELWVDDIRLDAAGECVVASRGRSASAMNAADFGDLHVNIGNRDPQFRQLGEQPTFLSERNVDRRRTINLDRLLPRQFRPRAAADDQQGSRWRTIRCICRKPTSPGEAFRGFASRGTT